MPEQKKCPTPGCGAPVQVFTNVVLNVMEDGSVQIAKFDAGDFDTECGECGENPTDHEPLWDELKKIAPVEA